MPEVGQHDELVTNLAAKLTYFLVGQPEQVFQNTELMHQLERGWVNGVTAKVAQEIGMLLEDNDVDAGTRQQEAKHQSRRTAAGNAAARLHVLWFHSARSYQRFPHSLKIRVGGRSSTAFSTATKPGNEFWIGHKKPSIRMIRSRNAGTLLIL